MKKVLFWFFSILFLLGMLVSFPGKPKFGELLNYSSGFLQIKSPVNNSEKELKIFSSDFTAELYVDSLGIPHIYADTDESAAFAMGYIHARDRYFQMELMIRVVQGKVGELLGYRKGILESDIFWRSFLFEENAKELYKKNQQENPAFIQRLNAYAKGVNNYLQNMKHSDIPDEYFILSAKPREWKDYYPLMLVKYMAHMLSYKRNDIYLQRVLNDLPKNIIETFYSIQEPYLNTVIPEKQGEGKSVPDYMKIAMNSNTGILSQKDYEELENQSILGSNNWVVSGKKTKSGAAILANDMHLRLSLPGPWYEVHVKTKDKHIYGQSIPAAPIIIAGFNGTVAWGMTNAHWDLVDYYKVDYIDSSKKKYYLGKEVVGIEEKTEIISFKDKNDTTITIRNTRLGPILNVVGTEFAVRWTAQNDATEPMTFQKFETVQNWDDFRNALSYFKSPPQNFVYADITGNIGLYTAGNMPLKNSKNLRAVLRTSLIEDNEFDFVPFEELPHIYNPEKGFIQSANQRQIYNYKYYVNWATMTSPYRGLQIHDLLESKDSIDVSFIRDVQADIVDRSSDHLLPILFDAIPGEDELYLYCKELERWDKKMETSSVAATIYLEFMTNLIKDYRGYIHNNISYLPPNDWVMIHYLMNNKTLITFDGTIDRKKLVSDVFKKTITKLKTEFGDDHLNWTYGRYHLTYMQHLLRIPAFSHPAFSSQGNIFTVNVAKNRNTTHGASQRHIFHMKKEIEAYANIAGGQSGRPSSPNFDNQVKDWRNVQHHPVQYIEKEKLKSLRFTIKIGSEK